MELCSTYWNEFIFNEFRECRPVESPASSVEKAVDLLFHLHGANGAQGVTELGRALGIPKSSTHRMLQSLGKRGLVERDDRGKYRPGVALLALGLGVLDREPLAVAARPILEEQAGQLGETFFLVVARARQLVVLDKAEGTGFLRAAPRVGASVPVHATAVGKLFLAFNPESLAPVDLNQADAFTQQTLLRPEALASAVEQTRARGWASNRDEWIQGLSVLAAPVRRGDGMLGAVALAASTARLDELGEEALVERVIATGDSIAARVGLEGKSQ
jgi:IclR family acetate operon transcriptional repressor